MDKYIAEIVISIMLCFISVSPSLAKDGDPDPGVQQGAAGEKIVDNSQGGGTAENRGQKEGEQKSVEPNINETQDNQTDQIELENKEIEKPEPEKKEPERQEIEKKETKRPEIKEETSRKKDTEKKEIQLFDKDSREYIGLVFGCGGFFPVADYGARYHATHFFDAGVPVYYLTLWRFFPEFHFRYAKMKSRFDPIRYGSNITLMEFFPAIAFRWDFGLPGKFQGPVQVFARIYDGIARTAYRSVNSYFPILGTQEIVENINVFGFSVGFNVFLYKGLFVGIDAGYSVVATAGKQLQSMSFMAQVGYRLF